jgi:hypothetical protein
MELAAILAGLLPLGIDLGKLLLNKIFPQDSYKPTSVAEWLQMEELKLKRFQAMQDPGTDTGYPIVNALLRLQKPAFATLVLLLYAYQETSTPEGASQSVTNFAQAVGFWLFGETGLFVTKRAAAAMRAQTKVVE